MRISIRLWIGLGAMLWSAVAQAGELTTRDAPKHVGETATVCGIVVSPAYRPDVRGQPTFLNLDKPYPNQDFTAVIWGEDRAAFGSPEVELSGERICVTGEIRSYQGHAEIILHRPRQLTK